MEGLTPEVMAENINKSIEAIKGDLAKAVTPEQLEAVKSKQEELNTLMSAQKEALTTEIKAEVSKLEEVVKTQGTEMAKLMEKGNHTGAVTFEQAVNQALTKEKFEELKAWKENKTTTRFSIDITKDTLTTNVTTSAMPNNAVTQNQTTYSELPMTEVFLESFLDTGSTDKPTIAYTSEIPGAGDAAIVAEGSLKPLIDCSTVTNYSEAKKVAGRKRISEEALSDFPFMRALITKTLKRKHDIARQNDVLTQIQNLATPFNAALVNAITVPNPQNYDAICAVAVAIEVDSEGTFMPNVAFVNSIDALQMKLTKDADGNYVIPPFKGDSGRVIDGITIVAKPSIPLGTFIIGDAKNVKLRNYWNYRVEFGRDGNDFSENMITAIGESRFHLYIDQNERRGLVAGNLADVITAIS